MLAGKKIFLFFLLACSLTNGTFAQQGGTGKVQSEKGKWEAKVPEFASNPADWINLLNYYDEQQLRYLSLAASYRILLLFDDVNANKVAFQNLVKLIDLGYPNSLDHMFILGSLELQEKDDFSQSYNFYKAIINKVKGMTRWSDDFMSRVDQETFKKYLFFQAVNLYSEKKLDEAIKELEKILKLPLALKDFTFSKKVVRTLARAHFEKKDYERSLQFYEQFLLKTNPVNPSDWVERAWNLYYLKRYEEAIGSLYNLETSSLKYYHGFEKYIIRASIYLNSCATEHVSELIKSFNDLFRESIKNIINGKPLASSPDIAKVAETSDPKYKELMDSVKNLKEEYDNNQKSIPSGYKGLTDYLYRSESRMLNQYAGFFKEKAYTKAAEELTMLAESLRFLEFGTAREKYNPAVVFLPREDKDEELIKMIDLKDRGFIFQWRQTGEFWRDERLKYRGQIEDKCEDVDL